MVNAVFPINFDSIVNALKSYDPASNIYFTILGTNPRVAIAFGQKWVARIGNYLTCLTIVIEKETESEVKVIAHAGLRLFTLSDYGASSDYAMEILNHLAQSLNAEPGNVIHVDYMNATKSQQLN